MAVGGLTGFTGPSWRGVAAGREAAVLDGTARAGRYNRPGEPTLYMSGSPDGVAAAMARYGEAPRSLIQLWVEAAPLLDLRDPAASTLLGIDAATAQADWQAALRRGEEPPSWSVVDRARAAGAVGLIDPSRHAPDLWHLVLFRWNGAGGARVAVRPAMHPDF